MWRWLLAAGVLAGQSFERDVQPVFRKHCYGCHAANVKIGSLDVQTYEGILRGGNQGTIVVPGRAEESRLYLTLTGAMEPVMPRATSRPERRPLMCAPLPGEPRSRAARGRAHGSRS